MSEGTHLQVFGNCCNGLTPAIATLAKWTKLPLNGGKEYTGARPKSSIKTAQNDSRVVFFLVFASDLVS